MLNGKNLKLFNELSVPKLFFGVCQISSQNFLPKVFFSMEENSVIILSDVNKNGEINLKKVIEKRFSFVFNLQKTAAVRYFVSVMNLFVKKNYKCYNADATCAPYNLAVIA